MTDSTNLLNPVTPIYNGLALSDANPLPVSVENVDASFEATATAATPTYVEGTSNPLSQDLTGRLRVFPSNANTTPIFTEDAALTTSDLTSAVVDISTATTTAIVSATASQTTRVYRMRLNVAAAQAITVKDGTTALEVLNFVGAGFLVYDFSSRPWYKTTANTALNFTTTTTGQVNGVVEYIKSA